MAQALDKGLSIPAHFGYDRHLTLADWYSADTYLVFVERDKIIQEVLPEVPAFKFNPGDFEELAHDRNVDKLYTNGGFDTYLIHTYTATD